MSREIAGFVSSLMRRQVIERTLLDATDVQLLATSRKISRGCAIAHTYDTGGMARMKERERRITTP